MRVRVIDASALGALVFGEAKAEEIASALADVAVVAPALLWFEMASICLKKIKAHPQETDQIFKAFSLSSRLGIEIIEVEHPEVVQLAKENGVTTYDASYLWLANSLRGELVTLDQKMIEAASRLRIAHP